MLPTLDSTNTLVFTDCFTTRFIRRPNVGEIVMCNNPYKPGHTIVKRVLFTEGQRAKYYNKKEGRSFECDVPEGHIWIEGDNKDNSKDSREIGPISVSLVDGIVRYKIWPYD